MIVEIEITDGFRITGMSKISLFGCEFNEVSLGAPNGQCATRVTWLAYWLVSRSLLKKTRQRIHKSLMSTQ
jgi:hypothetical protein